VRVDTNKLLPELLDKSAIFAEDLLLTDAEIVFPRPENLTDEMV
jgi:hypothetical protein